MSKAPSPASPPHCWARRATGWAPRRTTRSPIRIGRAATRKRPRSEVSRPYASHLLKDHAMLAPLNGATRVHFTIGDPIAQVKSPAGISQGFACYVNDAIMIPLQVKPADIDAFFLLAKKLPNVDGIVITVPHKPVAFRHCDTTTERARVLEVCNVMRRNADGRWHGDMTDGGGFTDALKRSGFDPKGKRALQVGAGGAGSALALSLCMEGVSALSLCDTDSAKRDALIARLARHGHKVAAVDKADPTGHDLVVNATPAGMRDGDP